MPESGGGTAIGNILSAFASAKPNIKYSTIDQGRQGRLNSLWGQYDVLANPARNNAYLTAYAAATPQASQISQGNLGFLNRYATQDFHPEDLYKNLLGQNQAALGSFLMNPALADLTRQRKETQARLGRTGGPGIYDTLLQGRLQQALAQQAVPNLLGYTGQAFQTAGGLRNQDLMNRLGLIGSGLQYGQLDMPISRYLEPQRLGQADLLRNLGNLGGLSTQEDLNRAYYREPGKMERWANALNWGQQGLVNEANQFADLYQRYMGMFGGVGGMGGGAAGGAKPATGGGSAPGYFSGSGLGSNNYQSWSNYGYDPYKNFNQYYPTGQ